MKKIYLLALASLGVAMISCNKESSFTAEDHVTTYNYVCSLDDSKAPVIKKGSYTLFFDYTSKTIKISTNMVDLGGNEDETSFSTPPIVYDASLVNFQGNFVNAFSGVSLNPCTSSNGMEVKDLKFEFSPTFYEPPTITYTPDPTSGLPQPDLSFKARQGFAPKMRYVLGNDYIVYTFWTDLYYTGVTNTEVIGDDSSAFQSQDIGYRIKFDLKTNKCQVVLYNVQFNPNMPKMECLILPNLDVNFTNNGYIIEAENVNPLYIEGGKIMENPRFPFTSFKFTAENNMVEGSCEFTVAGRFRGNFLGKYMEFTVR